MYGFWHESRSCGLTWNEALTSAFRCHAGKMHLPHQLPSAPPEVQNFSETPWQRCKSAPWYLFRRTQGQNIAWGLEEFCFLLSQVANLELFLGWVGLCKASWSWHMRAGSLSTQVGVGSLEFGMSWPGSLTTWELMAGHLTTLWWFGQLSSEVEIWDRYPENYTTVHLHLGSAKNLGQDDVWLDKFQFVLRGTWLPFSPIRDTGESDKPLEILLINVPGAKLRVIRNNNSGKRNLDDVNLFPLDLSHTNQLEKEQLNPRKYLVTGGMGRGRGLGKEQTIAHSLSWCHVKCTNSGLMGPVRPSQAPRDHQNQSFCGIPAPLHTLLTIMSLDHIWSFGFQTNSKVTTEPNTEAHPAPNKQTNPSVLYGTFLKL